MKKLLAVLFVLAMVVGLAACGSSGDGRYDGAPRGHIRAAREAVRVVDNFLDRNMEALDAIAALREIQSGIGSMGDNIDIEAVVEGAAAGGGMEMLATIFVAGDIEMLTMALQTYSMRRTTIEIDPSVAPPTLDSVLELRNQIAASLGIRLR